MYVCIHIYVILFDYVCIKYKYTFNIHLTIFLLPPVPLTLGPVLLRSFKAETLPELWRSLPRMKTIAQPFGEQEALLSGYAHSVHVCIYISILV
jgi:hypothetical protein